MEKRNWSKNQETKFSETHFAQKNWNRDVWERKKRTQKYLDKNLWRQAFVLKN